MGFMIQPTQALTGARQGCLMVWNKTAMEVGVGLKGSNMDEAGPWYVEPGKIQLIGPNVGAIVSEQTEVMIMPKAPSGGVDLAGVTIATLKEDPTTRYFPTTKNRDCPITGMWAKPVE